MDANAADAKVTCSAGLLGISACAHVILELFFATSGCPPKAPSHVQELSASRWKRSKTFGTTIPCTGQNQGTQRVFLYCWRVFAFKR